MKRYAIAVLTTAIAFALTQAFASFLAPMRLLFLWVAILVTALAAGTRPGIVAILLSSIAAAYLVFAPIGSIAIASPTDLARLGLFIVFAVGIVLLAALRRRAEERAFESDRWLATTLGSIGDAVIATDAHGCVVFMNAVAEHLTGWRTSNAKTRSLAEIFVVINEDTRAAVESPVERVLREGRVVALANHTVLVRPDGSELPIEDTAAPIRDANGNLTGVVLVFHDVTRPRALQKDLRRHADEAAFINRATDILGSSLDYATTLRNLAKLCVPELGDWCAIDIARDAGSYEMLAVEHADPEKARLVFELDRRFRPAPEGDPVVQVIMSGKPQLLEQVTDEVLQSIIADPEHLAIVRGLGLRSWIVAPMIARGRTLGAIIVVHGESGRTYSEEDVPLVEELARRAAMAIDNARLFAEAQAASHAKDEFLATLSHELRTPLTAIAGWASMLRMGGLDEPTTRTAIETINRSAQTQGELIDELLDLSRVVAGKLRLDVSTVNFASIVEQSVVAARPAASSRDVALTLTQEAPVVLVRGDERRLRQIVWNLLTNAIKFTDAGGTIDVTLSMHGATTRLEVRDTGRGIEPSFLPHVWERFRQADSSTSRAHGGLGLGLAVVRHLVDMHGGTVTASSEGAGQGSTFTVELPVTQIARIDQETAPPREPTMLRGRRVLVVDDDLATRTMLQVMLAQHGADVAIAADVDEAIRAFESRAFDVVLSDIAMPGEDGFDLLRRIRTTSEVPVIAISAMGAAEDRARALEAGFTEFLRKPIDAAQLTEHVGKV